MERNGTRLLILVHNDARVGGVELQTQYLARGLVPQYEVAVAAPHHPSRQIVLTRVEGSCQVWPAEPVPFPVTPYHFPQIESVLAEIIQQFKPELIHFQHLLNWPLSAVDQALASGAKVAVSFYDYYAITPAYTMQGVRDPAETLTAEYSQTLWGSDLTAYLQERRQILLDSLGRVNARIVLSEFTARMLSSVYPLDFRVIEPGIVPFRPLPRVASQRGLRFGYIGRLIRQKGWMPLVDAFEEVRKKHPEAELRLYGGRVPPGDPPSGVTFLGDYRPADLPRIFSEFDVGVIPSIFPETFSIVLSEMWQAGIPAAVADIGALGERVIDDENGRKFPAGDIGAMAATLNWFLECDAWRRWRLPKPRTVADLVADHDTLYHHLLS